MSKFGIIILICLGLSFITYPSYAQRVSRRGVVVQDSGTTAGTGRTLNFGGDITVDCTTDASKCTLDTDAVGAMGVKDEANALNHDKYTDTNAVEAVAAGDDYIINSGADTMTGNLTINKSQPSIILKDTTTGPTTIEFQDSLSAQKATINKGVTDLLTIDAIGGVQLLHNNVVKLKVDAAGVDVTGTLDATGVITGTKLMTADGTALLPTHSWTNDVNTGMYSSGADEIGFTAAGVQQMTVSSTAVSINNLTNGGAGCPLVETTSAGVLTCGTSSPFSDTKCFYVEAPGSLDTSPRYGGPSTRQQSPMSGAKRTRAP